MDVKTIRAPEGYACRNLMDISVFVHVVTMAEIAVKVSDCDFIQNIEQCKIRVLQLHETDQNSDRQW